MQELRYINLDAFCPCLRLNCKGMIRFSVMKTRDRREVGK